MFFDIIVLAIGILFIAVIQVCISQIWLGGLRTSRSISVHIVEQVVIGGITFLVAGPTGFTASICTGVALGMLLSALWSWLVWPYLHRHPELVSAARRQPVDDHGHDGERALEEVCQALDMPMGGITAHPASHHRHHN